MDDSMKKLLQAADLVLEVFNTREDCNSKHISSGTHSISKAHGKIYEAIKFLELEIKYPRKEGGQ